MPECVIVAIPEDQSQIHKISSERVAHLTLLYLGELDPTVDEVALTSFVEHVASTMSPFGLSVANRGTLGDDDADVLFFEKTKSNLSRIEVARSYLLTDPQILKAYNSVDQYPEWTPHLTLGYPETPAKPPKDDYIPSWVFFDKIAVWFGDSTGPTFKLKDRYRDEEGEMAMADNVDNFLAHFGVKGMRWGVRRDRPDNVEVSIQERPGRKRLKAKGGEGRPASEDAKRTAVTKQIAKRNSTDALSNQELQDLVNRMNLEQQYSRLVNGNNEKSTIAKGTAKVKELLEAKNTAERAINDPHFQRMMTDIKNDFEKAKKK